MHIGAAVHLFSTHLEVVSHVHIVRVQLHRSAASFACLCRCSAVVAAASLLLVLAASVRFRSYLSYHDTQVLLLATSSCCSTLFLRKAGGHGHHVAHICDKLGRRHDLSSEFVLTSLLPSCSAVSVHFESNQTLCTAGHCMCVGSHRASRCQKRVHQVWQRVTSPCGHLQGAEGCYI
jgi:hypothetical protein